MEVSNEIVEKLRGLAQRYRSDSEFRAKVDADPVGMFRSEGCGGLLPEGIAVNLHLDDEKTMHVVFPPMVRFETTGDEELEAMAGGSCQYWNRSQGYYSHDNNAMDRSRPYTFSHNQMDQLSPASRSFLSKYFGGG